jgi:hypothetical protein
MKEITIRLPIQVIKEILRRVPREELKKLQAGVPTRKVKSVPAAALLKLDGITSIGGDTIKDTEKIWE